MFFRDIISAAWRSKNHYYGLMSWIKAGFLIFVLTMSSGYRFRCWMFCMDQTSTQHEYIEQRDRCRSYAELKQDMQIRGTVKGPVTNRDRKTALVSLFNECMAENGYNIANPGPPPPVATNTAVAALAPAPSPQPQAMTAAPVAAKPMIVERNDGKAALSRTAECNFARHASKHSSISATRAKACDLECTQRLKASPNGPRPAACPSDRTPDPEMERGVDRGE
jgi:hypothetical protein